MASEITARDTSAMANARRMASGSVAFLKGVTTRQNFEPSNDTDPVAAVAAEAAPVPSVISKNAVISGSFSTTDDLHIHGTVDGDVRAAKISICAGGTVKGDLTAEMIVVHGDVEGRIHGGDVVICAGAVVKGEITHRSLGIDTAAIFEGSVKRVQD